MITPARSPASSPGKAEGRTRGLRECMRQDFPGARAAIIRATKWRGESVRMEAFVVLVEGLAPLVSQGELRTSHIE